MLTRSLANWHSQYERMKRSYARLLKSYVSSIDYDDDLLHFFQDCWHLKDWIKNDLSIPRSIRDVIEVEVQTHRSLRIAADLANGWKHLELRNARAGADVTSKSVTIGPRGAETYHTVGLDDGSALSAQELAQTACDDWDVLLRKLGLN